MEQENHGAFAILEIQFDQAFQLLSQYQWIHDLQLTQFLASKVWKNIPQDWLDAFTNMPLDLLNQVPFLALGVRDNDNQPGVVQPPKVLTTPVSHQTTAAETWLPSLMKDVLQRCSNLSIPRQQAVALLPGPARIGKDLKKGMTPKKIHEVEWMASLVHQVASQSDCSIIIDVGSGLGYLGQVLHEEYGRIIIGLENCKSHRENAEKRAEKQGMRCSGIRNVPFFLSDSDESVHEFSLIVSDAVSSVKPCQHSANHMSATGSFTTTLTRNSSVFHSQNSFAYSAGSSQNSSSAIASPFQNSSPPSLFSTQNLCAASSLPSQNTSPADLSDTLPYAEAQIGDSTVEFQKQKEMAGGDKTNVNDLVKDGEECADKLGRDWRACLIGLHCCGDLTPAMLRLYHRVPFLRALCCVSCCYHKMRFCHRGGAGGSSGEFINFPMSEAARSSYSNTGMDTKTNDQPVPLGSTFPKENSSSLCTASITSSCEILAPRTSSFTFLNSRAPSCDLVDSAIPSWHFLSPSSLRLAAQETRTRWLSQSLVDHEKHARHVGYRSLLEIFFIKTGHAFPDRRVLRRLDYSSFDAFVNSFVSLESKEKQKEIKKEMYSLYESNSPYLAYVEPFTCLQVVLQPVLESLVVNDRLQWLHERQLPAQVVAVFDEHISPRNLALLSNKPGPVL